MKKTPPQGTVHGVNVMCLHRPDLEQRLAAPVTYVDRRHDRWEATPAQVGDL